MDVTFYVTDKSDKTYLGSFKVSAVPFNTYAYEYYITADKLKTLAECFDSGELLMRQHLIDKYYPHDAVRHDGDAAA